MGLAAPRHRSGQQMLPYTSREKLPVQQPTLRLMAAWARLVPLALVATAVAGPYPSGSAPQETKPKKTPVQEDVIPEGTLGITVVDERGTPIEGVRLSGRYHVLARNIDPIFSAEPKNLPARFPRSSTNAEGTKYIKCLTDRPISLKVGILQLPPALRRSEQIMEQRTIEIPALHADELRTLEVVLRTQNDATFRAKLVDGVGGPSVAGATVLRWAQWQSSRPTFVNGYWLNDAPTPLEPTDLPLLKSDPSGEFELDAATWRLSTALVSAPGFASCEWTMGGREDSPGLQEPIDIALRRESFLEVTLLDAPEDIELFVEMSGPALAPAGAPPTPFDPSKMASSHWYRSPNEPIADGHATFNGLPPNERVILHFRRDQRTVKVECLTTGAPGATQSLTFDAAPHCSVSGTFFDPAGVPVVGADLTVQSVTQGLRPKGYARTYSSYQPALKHRIKTAAGGRFQLDDLMPGTYLIVPKTLLPKAGTSPPPRYVTLSFERPDADVALNLTPPRRIAKAIEARRKRVEEARRRRKAGAAPKKDK